MSWSEWPWPPQILRQLRHFKHPREPDGVAVKEIMTTLNLGSAWFRNTNTDPLSLPVSLWCNSFSFYRATLCVSTIFAVAWCLSVCLSVRPSDTLVHCIQTAEYIVKLLCRPNSPIILLFWPPAPFRIPSGTHEIQGVENFWDFRPKSPSSAIML